MTLNQKIFLLISNCTNKTTLIILIVTCIFGFTSIHATLYDGDPCTRKDGQAGICKSLDTCEWARVNRIRPNQLNICSFSGSKTIVCCGDVPEKHTNPTVVTPESCQGVIFDPDTIDECVELLKGTTTTSKSTVGSRTDVQCKKLLESRGPTTISLDFHIYGGDEASPGEFPSFAALGYESQEIGQEYEFNCGGTLITSRHILTAAHCLHPASPDVVRLGTIDLHSQTYQQIRIGRIEEHPGYKPSSKVNDIAVLILSERVDISDPTSVFPACLDSLGNYRNSQNVTVVGFGKTEHNNTKSDLLLKATLQLVDREACSNKFKEVKLFALRNGINDGQLCAWDSEFKRDSCQGDSGGPLYLHKNNTNYLIGLTSFGSGCATKLPGVYTKVLHYIDWIEKIVFET